MRVESSFYFSLNIEITNTLYESHRYSKKKNSINLNRLLRHENPCQTEFIHTEELHTKKVMEYRQKSEKFAIGTQIYVSLSISSVIKPDNTW